MTIDICVDAGFHSYSTITLLYWLFFLKKKLQVYVVDELVTDCSIATATTNITVKDNGKNGISN